MEAPASPAAKVVIHEEAGENIARYTLSYLKDGEEPRVLWRTQIDTSPDLLEEGCALLSTHEGKGELSVLMESNIVELRLVRLNLPDGKLIEDRKFRAAALMRRLPYEGGILQVKVPNRIAWKNTEGKTRRFVIEDGKLRGIGEVGFDPSSFDPGWPTTPPDSPSPGGTTER
ncbi:hypothetical protein [Luteolibacter marinus]|uniref:hypothetical protein n=1 Tax=Luteolibacter marinus TaxID=2776705 RepID=UPI001865FE0E|nr:hypothetical protein [Luteolibacter marinus]